MEASAIVIAGSTRTVCHARGSMRVLAIATVVLGLAGGARAELDKPQIRKVIKAHILELVACFDHEPPPPDQTAYVDFTICAARSRAASLG